LRINPDWYRKRLLGRWPGIVFFKISPEDYLLEWGLPVSAAGAAIHAGIQSNQNVVDLDTPFEEFFLWHLQIIPDQYRLYLFNDSSWDSLELTPDTTIGDIQQFVGGRT
jgi:hypothetical protein